MSRSRGIAMSRGEVKRRRGRPRLPAAAARSRAIVIRVTPAEYAAVQELASRAGMGMSGYLLQCGNVRAYGNGITG